MQKVILPLFLLFCFNTGNAQKRKKSKEKTVLSTDYTSADVVPDSTTRFTGIIKYTMTSDEPSERDSMFVIFGEKQIRVTMFVPGYKEKEVFENNMIADFRDNVLFILDIRNKTYSIEKLGLRNSGIEFNLSDLNKKGQILQTPCKEYNGEMQTKEGDIYNVNALASDKHSSVSIKDYNFLNIQPIVIGYKIVLAYKSKSANNENTMIVAYKIEPVDTAGFFDLSEYRQK